MQNSVVEAAGCLKYYNLFTISLSTEELNTSKVYYISSDMSLFSGRNIYLNGDGSFGVRKVDQSMPQEHWSEEFAVN